MTRFEFATAAQILFGEKVVDEVGPLAAGLGQKALVTVGSHGPNLERLRGVLEKSGLPFELFDVHGEPSVAQIEEGLRFAKAAGCEVIIGFGGGSAVDTAKAIAALLTNPGDPLDYLEVVGRNQPLRERSAPFLAVPTTAGTGSEVTRNAVLSVPEKQVKVSLRSPLMLARAAVVDPELTYSLPPEITASTGMDAVAQVIEPYVSRRSNPLTDLYCKEGIRRGSRSLLRAYQHGQDMQARQDMAFTSLMGGLALANAGLGAVHGFAGPVGGMFEAPHGAVCAILLPPVVAANARALIEREPGNPALDRYREVAQIVTGREDAQVQDLVNWLEELRTALHLPALSQYGLKQSDIPAVVEKSAVASSMKANPIVLTNQELSAILDQALVAA